MENNKDTISFGNKYEIDSHDADQFYSQDDFTSGQGYSRWQGKESYLLGLKESEIDFLIRRNPRRK